MQLLLCRCQFWGNMEEAAVASHMKGKKYVARSPSD